MRCGWLCGWLRKRRCGRPCGRARRGRTQRGRAQRCGRGFRDAGVVRRAFASDETVLPMGFARTTAHGSGQLRAQLLERSRVARPPSVETHGIDGAIPLRLRLHDNQAEASARDAQRRVARGLANRCWSVCAHSRPDHVVVEGRCVVEGVHRKQLAAGPHSADAACDECCLLYTSPSPRDGLLSRMPSSA